MRKKPLTIPGHHSDKVKPVVSQHLSVLPGLVHCEGEYHAVEYEEAFPRDG